nr:MAG TPA: hypothetical protein [Caudoviricetes sp.]
MAFLISRRNHCKTGKNASQTKQCSSKHTTQ